jgi:hypothetical protein
LAELVTAAETRATEKRWLLCVGGHRSNITVLGDVRLALLIYLIRYC